MDAVLPDLTNRVNLANPVMPADVRQSGLTIKKASSNILMIVAISSDGSQDPNFVSNYANINVVDELKRIPGASQVSLFTMSDYAMRIWLKPDRMAELNFTVSDIRQRHPGHRTRNSPSARSASSRPAIRWNSPCRYPPRAG
ncbi:MAG: efflux RND transporter permease subunit [Candidatus Competibacter sp.]